MYEIHSTFSRHEGGTKFYQVFAVTCTTSRRAVVTTHWGPVHPGASIFPRHFGQRKIELHETGGISAYHQARRNKQKRGYNDWSDKVWRGDSRQLETQLATYFSDADVEKIIEYMVDGVERAVPERAVPERDEDGVPVHDAFPQKTAQPKKPAPKTEEDHPEWGAW